MSTPTPDDKHPFRMNVKDGIGRDRSVELVARQRQVVMSSPHPEGGVSWKITLTPDQGDTLSAILRAGSTSPFTMDVQDGLGRFRPIVITGDAGGVASIWSPANSWTITFDLDQRDTLAAAVQGASDRASKQVQKP